MADWQYPTGAYKAYVPGGRFGRGIGRGLRQLGQGLGQWGAQILAIKQWEAEKEEKRLQQQRERAAAYVEGLAKEQQWMRDQIAKQEFEKFKHGLEMEMKVAERAGKDWEAKQEKLNTEIEKALAALSGVQSDLGGRYAQDIEQAWREGNLNPIYQVMIQIPTHPELAYGLMGTKVTGEGEEQKATKEYGALKDAGILRDVARRLIAIGQQQGMKLTKEPVQLGETATFYAEVKNRLMGVVGKSKEEKAAVLQQLLNEGVNPNLIKQVIGEIERMR